MYKYDLHVHTFPASACGNNPTGDMIKQYKDCGFSGFVLTNHFFHGNTGISRSLLWSDFIKEYSKDYYNALETAQKLDFDLLFGVEEYYGAGKEILVYGITPEILIENPILQNMDINTWSKVIRENDGFIAYAHPFRNRNYIENPYEMPDISLVDGIECYNYCNTRYDDELAVKIFNDSGKIIIAGGDLHHIKFSDSFGIKTKQRIKDEKQLAEVLKSNDFELYLGE